MSVVPAAKVDTSPPKGNRMPPKENAVPFWFRNKHLIVAPAHIWRDMEEKFAGLVALIREARATHLGVLAIGHFAETIRRLEQELRRAGIAFGPFEKGSISAHTRPVAGEPAPVWIASSDLFSFPEPAAEHWDKNAAVAIFVADRYPIAEPERLVEAFAESLPFLVSLTYCCSLDDPLIRWLTSGQTLDLLTDQLGKGECLRHHLIGKSIRSVQRRAQKGVPREQKTDNAEAWFRTNLPDESPWA